MNEAQILEGIKKYFTIEELVDPNTFDKWGERSWMFLCPRLLRNLLFMRECIGKPFTVNNWHKGGRFDERGLRSNVSAIVRKKTKEGKLYLSAHTMGKAVDFVVKDMEAKEVREWAKENEADFPYKARFENKINGKQISWVHMDVYYEITNPTVYLFDV